MILSSQHTTTDHGGCCRQKEREMSHRLRNIDGLLNLQGNAQPSGKNTLSLAARYHPGNACPTVHDAGQKQSRFQGMYHKDDDGTGDNRRLVLFAKQRSLPILPAASLTFNLYMDELITKPLLEPTRYATSCKQASNTVYWILTKGSTLPMRKMRRKASRAEVRTCMTEPSRERL